MKQRRVDVKVGEWDRVQSNRTCVCVCGGLAHGCWRGSEASAAHRSELRKLKTALQALVDALAKPSSKEKSSSVVGKKG